jgi:hypothetical protein
MVIMHDGIVDYRGIATNLSRQAIDHIIATSTKVLKEYWAKFRNRDSSCYAEYLVHKGIQANAVRNFIYDTTSASLHDIYVPTRVSSEQSPGANPVLGDRLVRFLCEAGRPCPGRRPTRTLAIVGNAGTGKSLFMRYAFFEIQKLHPNRIPLLIEARSFNLLPLASIGTRIYEDFLEVISSVTREQITNGLEAGLFVILLDGMDELKVTIKRHYESELTLLARRYPLCPIMVSSRPSETMQSWNFDIRPLAPLDLSTAESLIRKLTFDEQVKSSFIDLLKNTPIR